MSNFRKTIFCLCILALAVIAVVGGSVCGQGGQPGWQGTAGNPSKFLTEVAKGNVPGHSIIHKFGHADVGTTMVPITHSLVYQTPTTAIALEVVSDDADDTSAGAGARTVLIEGLALDGSIVTQTVALNGLTAVSIPTPLWRLYRWQVATSGVYATTAVGSHQGTLTIRVASAGATWSILDVLPTHHSQSEIGWYTVPNNFRAYILSMEVTVDSTKAVDIMVLRRENADTVSAPFSALRLITQAVGVAGYLSLGQSLSPHNSFGEMCDIGFMAKVASSTAEVTCHFEILLIADGY